jgi:hypothetical protein
MRLRQAKLFELIQEPEIDGICIPTTGSYSRQGIPLVDDQSATRCIKRWPAAGYKLGKILRFLKSNIPLVIGALDDKLDYLELTREIIDSKSFKCLILNFPIKYRVDTKSSIDKIKESSILLKEWVNQFGLKNIIIPCPEDLKHDKVLLEIGDTLDEKYILTYE